MSAAQPVVTIVYRLIWVTSLGYAGSEDDKTYASVESAMSDVKGPVTWSKEGRYDWRSSVDQYGDVYFVKARATY